MSDIVKMLRECSSDEAYLSRQAADRIAQLEAALHEAADELDAYYRAEYCGDHPYTKRKLAEAMRDNPARAAITPTPMEKT